MLMKLTPDLLSISTSNYSTIWFSHLLSFLINTSPSHVCLLHFVHSLSRCLQSPSWKDKNFPNKSFQNLSSPGIDKIHLFRGIVTKRRTISQGIRKRSIFLIQSPKFRLLLHFHCRTWIWSLRSWHSQHSIWCKRYKSMNQNNFFIDA